VKTAPDFLSKLPRQVIYRLRWCSSSHPDKYCTQSSPSQPARRARPPSFAHSDSNYKGTWYCLTA